MSPARMTMRKVLMMLGFQSLISHRDWLQYRRTRTLGLRHTDQMDGGGPAKETCWTKGMMAILLILEMQRDTRSCKQLSREPMTRCCATHHRQLLIR